MRANGLRSLSSSSIRDPMLRNRADRKRLRKTFAEESSRGGNLLKSDRGGKKSIHQEADSTAMILLTGRFATESQSWPAARQIAAEMRAGSRPKRRAFSRFSSEAIGRGRAETSSRIEMGRSEHPRRNDREIDRREDRAEGWGLFLFAEKLILSRGKRVTASAAAPREIVNLPGVTRGYARWLSQSS